MKLISWNVNGLRACLQQGLSGDLCRPVDADVICLQETKLQHRSRQTWTCRATTSSGTAPRRRAIPARPSSPRHEPLSVTYGLGLDDHRPRGPGHHRRVSRTSTWCAATPPTPRTSCSRLDYRMTWEDDFRAYLQELDENKPVILCGDLNVAAQRNRPEKPQDQPQQRRLHRRGAGEVAKPSSPPGFADTFRHLLPRLGGGLFLVELPLPRPGEERGVAHRLLPGLQPPAAPGHAGRPSYSEIYGSDHCPVELGLEL